MIRVIKEGNNLFEVTCNNCGSVLEYARSDVWHDILNLFGRDTHITCPVCKNAVEVNFKKVKNKRDKTYSAKELLKMGKEKNDMDFAR